jgi:2-polyprenyl-3-methyl-5-hydroxy-6-metoxy-1,4-benzoquinol methylase
VVIEVGAGDGGLARELAGAGVKVTALDFAPAPWVLPPGVTWRQGDLFETFSSASGDTLVACLILHHFEGEALDRLGELIRESGIRRVLAVEPHRSRLAAAQGRVLFPFVNRVTRHDMIVSIRAGFRCGELGEALGLERDRWEVEESITLMGAYRFRAERKE